MGEIKNNGGIKNSVETLREAIKETEKRMKYWRETSAIEIERKDFGKGWTGCQKYIIEMHDKKTDMLRTEEMIMEAIDSVISTGEQLLKQLQLPLRFQGGSIFSNREKAIERLDGAVAYLIEIRTVANSNLENGSDGSGEEFSHFIKGDSDFFHCDIVGNFFKCLN